MMKRKNKCISLPDYLEMMVGVEAFITNTEEKQKYEAIMRFYYLVLAISSLTDKMPFYKDRRNGRAFARATALGYQILYALELAENSYLFGHDESYAEHLSWSPQLKLAYAAFVAASIPGGLFVEGIGFVERVRIRESIYKYLRNADLDAAIAILNNFVLQLRKALRSKALREQIKSFERNTKERHRQLLKVAFQGWKRHCRNLLLRVDWAYRKEHSIMPIRAKTEAEMRQIFEHVEHIKEASLKRLRAIFGKDLTFYAWKIECGYYKGLHIHWLIAVNGAQYKNGWYTAQAIVNDWTTHVCGPDSYVVNVNGLDKKGTSGLGMIDYRDPHLADTLNLYTRYLTKTDLAMKLRAPKGMRTFGCSKLTKQPATKRGPKRSGRIAVSNA